MVDRTNQRFNSPCGSSRLLKLGVERAQLNRTKPLAPVDVSRLIMLNRDPLTMNSNFLYRCRRLESQTRRFFRFPAG